MFFNGGSSLGLAGSANGGTWQSAGLAITNTVIAPCAAGLFTMFTRKYITGQNKNIRLNHSALTNGLLAGCVAITAGCDAVQPWAALVIGLIGSLVYSASCLLMEKIQVDDPLEAF